MSLFKHDRRLDSAYNSDLKSPTSLESLLHSLRNNDTSVQILVLVLLLVGAFLFATSITALISLNRKSKKLRDLLESRSIPSGAAPGKAHLPYIHIPPTPPPRVPDEEKKEDTGDGEDLKGMVSSSSQVTPSLKTKKEPLPPPSSSSRRRRTPSISPMSNSESRKQITSTTQSTASTQLAKQASCSPRGVKKLTPNWINEYWNAA